MKYDLIELKTANNQKVLINKAFISNIVETSPNSKQCVIAVNDIHIKINESFDELKLQVYGRV
ncbi:MAG: hypothetical protein CMO82_11215 [Winogradskyella sp.]|uniref:Uncharacterized protein n=1 Tax=Winogradskyella poriferorum TaxID=307627 RepID=A0ABU7W0X8_9FLAO|nr:hypothetical protein [Winogradskyella sp.]HIC32602.1 hypothetical protein [Flavobacteriaceae bacterium]|tara:strand:- start:1101 stop:1289 length:189 start_codon:yes stop_codon:yes gene_type:complete